MDLKEKKFYIGRLVMIDYMDEKDGITYKKHEYAYIKGIANKNNDSANYVLLMLTGENANKDYNVLIKYDRYADGYAEFDKYHIYIPSDISNKFDEEFTFKYIPSHNEEKLCYEELLRTFGAYDHAFYIKSKKLSKIEQIAKKEKNLIAEKDLYNIIKLDSTLRLPKNSIFKIYNKTNPSCYDFCLHLSDFIDDYHKIKFLTGDYKGFECYLKHTIVDDKIIIELNDYISEDLSNITPYFNNEQLTYISDLEKTKKSLNPKR